VIERLASLLDYQGFQRVPSPEYGDDHCDAIAGQNDGS
jgi:hypothetical protein